MKIKRKFLALIVAMILIASSVLVFFTYQSVQDERVTYLGVRTDKDVYVAGENVTFDLVSLTAGADFNISDPGNADEYALNQGGVNIYRIPDLFDVDELLNDRANTDWLSHTIIMRDEHLVKIHYDFFDSGHGPLELAWNGTIKVYDIADHQYSYCPATSGNYMIIPDLTSEMMDHMVFLLDRGAVFHYDSLDTGLNIINNPDTNVTVELALRAPPGTVGDMNCDLFAALRYDDYGEFGPPDPFHFNRTGLVLNSDHDENLSFIFDVAIPDHGISYDENSASFTPLVFYATLVTPSGNYTFGLSAIWDGGWRDAYQY